MKAVPQAIVAVAMFSVSSSLLASTSPDIQCANGFFPATIDVTLAVSTVTEDVPTETESCPFRDIPHIRNWVNRLAPGTDFAHPIVGRTCLSGEITTGTIALNGYTVAVEGYSESAQRFFAEADAIGDPLFILAVDSGFVPFVSGAAMTFVSLSAVDDDLELEVDLLLEDRFTIDVSGLVQGGAAVDTEDFLVIGSRRDLRVKGRLTGSANVYSSPLEPLTDMELNVSGTVCAKFR